MSSVHLAQKEENEKWIVEIDHSVTGLLKCTKDLLEALTNWSIQSEHKERIYEQFNSLQSHFEKVCHAFLAANLSMDDLHHIPFDLKNCLDAALTQAPSDLQCHLPSIRDIILQLLQGLKRKQALLHDRCPSTRSSPTFDTNSTPSPPRNMTSSTCTYSSGEFDMMDPNTQQAFTQLRDDGDLASRSSIRRGNALDSTETPTMDTRATVIQPPVRRRRDLPTSPSQPTFSHSITPPTKRRTSTTTPSSPVTSLSTPVNTTPLTTKISNIVSSSSSPLLVLFLQWKNRIKRVVVSHPIENMTQLLHLFQCTFKNALIDLGHTKITILDNDTNIMYELDDITLVKTNTLLSLDDPNNNNNELMNMIQQAFETQFNQWANQVSTLSRNNSSNTTRSPDTSIITTLDTSLLNSGIATTTGASTSLTSSTNEIPASTTNQDQQQTTLIHQLKSDFELLQALIVEHQTNNEKLKSQLADYEHQQSIRQQQQDNHNDKHQKQQNTIQNQLQEKGQELTTRLETLQDTIDDMKQDVTQRRCRPSPHQLDHCHQESTAIKDMIRSLGNHITRSKPAWKKTWEEQLQRIVGEQQCVKEYEHLVADFEEDYAAIVTVLEHLTQVSELQQKRHSGKPLVVVGLYDDSTVGGREGMDHVLQQLQTIDVDHEKRLDALAQAEKRRARDMANRIDDFEKELITFVDTNKLKKTGGAEQLERQQEQKTKQLLMDLYDKNTRPT
ncbi:actin interacting protein 3-domain-containing protein [Chlamydoabsidia padenii]|nr:actin interacting protein 3-domain-containing protein [Chlamydoabsidia padenii]